MNQTLIDLVKMKIKTLQYEDLFWLAAKDIIFFSENDPQGWRACILLSDVYGYACADAEPILPEQAREVRNAYEKWKWSGVIAWVALKRNQEPLEEYRTPEYFVAKELLNLHVL